MICIGYAFRFLLRIVLAVVLCYAAFAAFVYLTVVAAIILGGMK